MGDPVQKDAVIPRVLLLCIAVAHALATDFFVSPRGDDTGPGSGETDAWQSLDRVNRHLRDTGLRPGDRILLQGGARFAGNLVLAEAGGGTRDQPVVVGSYGNGAAILDAGSGTGILVRETPWVTVSDLEITASGTNDGDGIRFDRIRTTGQRVEGASVLRCRIHGFAWHGVMVDASQRDHGYTGVWIADTWAVSNRYAGIQVYGGNPAGRTHHPHSNITIENCVAAFNPGDPEQLGHHSGSGIFVDGAERVLIRSCLATGNGGECRSERGGPVGIWIHACRSARIERCESYRNRSLLRDGGGFDIDGGCEDAILRWNYSHENEGPGLMVYSYTGAPYSDRGSRVYGNISWHDGRRASGYAGLQLGAEEGCRLQDLRVENNTVFSPPGSVAAVRVQGHRVEGVIRSNLVMAADHGVLVSFSGFDHRLRFEGNQYWRGDGRAAFLVDGQWPVAALGAWRSSTGPERRFSATGERFADPRLSVKLPGMPPGIPVRPRWPELVPTPPGEVGAPRMPPPDAPP